MKLASILVAALSTTVASAQITFETQLGAPIGAGAGLDWVVSGLSLGFPFQFPGPSLPTQTIDVTANGRILPGGTLATGDNGDFTPTPSELLAASHPTLAVFWKDMNFTSPLADDIYFNTFPGRAVITWRDAVQFAGTTPFLVQCQLFADGRIQFLYGADVESTLANAVVGVSPGSNPADPGESDFSTLALGAFSTGATAYEHYDILTLQTDSFDMQSFAVEFTPDGSGGYDLAGPTVGATEEFGLACEKSIQFFPDGSGGYTVVDCGACWDSMPGTDLGLLDETTTTVLLGFPFTFPGGQTVTQVTISDNGRIVPAGTFLTPDPLRSPFDFLSPNHPTIAGMWTNWDLSSGGCVTFRTSATSASITWKDVVQFGQDEPMTFQVILDAGDGITFVYRDTQRYVETPVTTLVGVTAGNALGLTSQSDFTNLPVVGGSTIYEWIDTTFGGGESWNYQLRLNPLTPPTLGGALTLQLEGIQANSTAAALLFGVVNPNLDLGLAPGLGLSGCFLYSNADLTTESVSIQGTTSSVFTVPIPSIAQIGLQAFVQGVTVTPGANPLGVVLSNGVRIIVGP